MIGRLSGKLLAKQPPQILIDVAGVGYEVDVPMSTFCKLPAEGESVTLLTHFVVREDALLLYGFATPAEREAFRALIRISGVGPRIALALLSGLTVDQLAQAVESGEAGLLTRVPGIGKKTAERLLLELKGKLAGAAILFPFGNRFEQYPRNRFLDMFETNFFGLFIKARIHGGLVHNFFQNSTGLPLQCAREQFCMHVFCNIFTRQIMLDDLYGIIVIGYFDMDLPAEPPRAQQRIG